MPDSTAGNLSKIFIGREAELEALSGFLSKARNGTGSFVALNGESGIGKTRLVEHFIENQNNREIIYVTESFKGVRPHEPYLPFLRIIEKINHENSVASMREVARQKFADREKDVFNTENLYALQSQHNVVKQRLLCNVLALAKNKVLIILLNDAELAPLTSWKFIHYLSESIHESNILLIAATHQNGREQNQADIPVYANVLQRMNREGIVHKIQLDRFDEQELKSYLHAAFPSKDFSSKLLPLILEISGGTPKQINRLVTELIGHGVIYQYEDVWVDKGNFSKDDFLNFLGGHQTFEEGREIVTNLSDEQKELLSLLALLDEPFNHRIVSTVSNLNRLKIVKALLNFQTLKILKQVDEESYKFNNSVLRKSIAAAIAGAEKTVKHQTIAEKIEADQDIESRDKVFSLAYHYHLGGQKMKAFRYLKAASEMAIENFAFLEALEFINKALDSVDELPKDEYCAEIAQLMIWAAWLERILGNLDNSIKNCEAAIGYLEEDKFRLIKSQALIQLGFTYFRLNNWNDSLRCFNECLEQAKSLGQFDRAMAEYGLGNVYFELADYEKSYKYFESALTLAQELQATQLMANVFNNLGTLENVRNHKMRAIALYSKSIPIFKTIGDDFGLARVYHNIGMTHADDNNWQQANEFYGQSLMVSDVMGLVPLKSITFLNRAHAFANLDNLAEAREYNVKAYRLLVSLKDELGIAEYNKVQGIIERKEKNWDTARNHFQIAQDKFSTLQNKLGLAESAFEFALLELDLQDVASAQEKFDLALKNYRELNLNEKVQSVQIRIEKLKRAVTQTLEPSTGIETGI